jgi:hypothetical protein
MSQMPLYPAADGGRRHSNRNDRMEKKPPPSFVKLDAHVADHDLR